MNFNNLNYIWLLDKKTKLTYKIYILINKIYIKYLNDKIIEFKFYNKYLNFINLKNSYKLNIYQFKTPILKKEMTLIFSGLGFSICSLEKNIIIINIGYSHKIYIKLPISLKFNINKEGTSVTFYGNNIIVLTTLIHKLRFMKLPDRYKGKGISYIFDKV